MNAQDSEKKTLDKQKISNLENQINGYDRSIADANARITKISRAYDSLVQFQSNVRMAHDNFCTVTSKHKQILNPLTSMSSENKCAKNYNKGMNKTLTGFGNNVVGLAFVGLSASIARKLSQYRNDISIAQSNIDIWNRSKADCQNKIKQEHDKVKE